LSIKGITIEFYQIGSGLEITADPDRSMIGLKRSNPLDVEHVYHVALQLGAAWYDIFWMGD
jgi:serine phosphatase RsbU (regulator of sigma subunit)